MSHRPEIDREKVARIVRCLARAAPETGPLVLIAEIERLSEALLNAAERAALLAGLRIDMTDTDLTRRVRRGRRPEQRRARAADWRAQEALLAELVGRRDAA